MSLNAYLGIDVGSVTTKLALVDENGKYTLKEYWTPQSGSNYKNDVRNKFPIEAAENALNTEKYAEELIKENWRLANEAFSKTKR